MRHKHLIVAALLLGGCAQNQVDAPPKFITEYPPARLMAMPEKLPEVRPGEELFTSNAQCSAAYVKESGKLIALQNWVTVLKR